MILMIENKRLIESNNLNFGHTNIVISFSAIICMCIIAFSIMELISQSRWYRLTVSGIMLFVCYMIVKLCFRKAMSEREKEFEKYLTE